MKKSPKHDHPDSCMVKGCKVSYRCKWYKRESVDKKWYCALHHYSAMTSPVGDPLATSKRKEEFKKLHETKCHVSTCNSMSTSKINGKGKFNGVGLCYIHDRTARSHDGNPLFYVETPIKKGDKCVVIGCNGTPKLHVLDELYCTPHYYKIYKFAKRLICA